jgi:hypothetical protein
MNIIERLEILRQVIAAPETAERLSQVAAFAVIAEYKNRIFVEGRATDGAQIGQFSTYGGGYSTEPFYQNPTKLTGVSSAGVTPQGKTGQSRFKNGNPHKTRYLPQGYKELRELTGRQSGYVDLNFSGALERSIKVVQDGARAVIRYTSDFEAEKMTGNEDRFGQLIHELSVEENEIGTTAAAEELRAILEEIDAELGI